MHIRSTMVLLIALCLVVAGCTSIVTESKTTTINASSQHAVGESE